MRIPKSKVLYVSAAMVALIGVPSVAASVAYKTVTVQDNGQRKVIRGFATGDLGNFLSEHGIQCTNNDKVSPSLTSPVIDGMNVVIIHRVTVTLVDGNSSRKLDTSARTVGDLLNEQGVHLRSGDQVNLPKDTPLVDGLTVRVTRIDKRFSVKTQDIPFQTIRQRTANLYVGEQRVLTHGVKGSMQIQTTSVFVNGHEVSQSVDKKVVQSAVNEVIQIGTRPRPQEPDTSGQQLSARGGGSLISSKKWTVVATAYVAGGQTAMGLPAQPGVIAVDPNVIPLGSKLYIPGVGDVVAADTGGAIVGNRIDICVSSESAAQAWGVRTVTVYQVQ